MTAIPTAEQIGDFVAGRVATRIGAVDRDQDLVESGLESIDAVMISGEIEDEYGIEIEPVLLFEARTINRAAANVRDLIAEA